MTRVLVKRESQRNERLIPLRIVEGRHHGGTAASVTDRWSERA